MQTAPPTSGDTAGTSHRTHRVAYWALWATIAAVPLEGLVVVKGASLTRMTGAVAVAAGAVAVGDAFRRRVPLRRPGTMQVLVAALAAWAGTSWLWSLDRGATVSRASTWAQILVLALLIHQFARTERDRELLLRAFLLGVAVASVDAVHNLVTDHHFRNLPGARYSGADLNPTAYGGLVVIATVIAWWVALTDERKSIRIPAGVFVAVSPLLVMLTFSRGALVAAALAWGLVAVHLLRRLDRRWLLAVPIALVAAVPLLAQVPSNSYDRLTEPLTDPTSSNAVTDRLDATAAVDDILVRRPLQGVGAGAYPEAAGRWTDVSIGAHNTPVSVLGELGVIGLALFGAVMVVAARNAWRRHAAGIWVDVWVLATWFAAALFLHWEHEKWTWVVLLVAGAETMREPAA